MAGETTKRNNDISGEIQYSFVWDLLLNPCTGIGGLVYALAMQCSSILYVLFEMKVVKCKLCESSSRFGGVKTLPRAVCSPTHFALVAIRLWTSWTLMMTLVYLRMEQLLSEPRISYRKSLSPRSFVLSRLTSICRKWRS